MSSSDLPFENYEYDPGLFGAPVEHNPGLHEIYETDQSPSRFRVIGASAVAGLALFIGVRAHNNVEQDSGYSAPEAHGSVLNTVPEIVPFETSLPASSRQKFDDHYQAIEQMRPVYEAIEQETGVSWEYMAALHYREGSNSPQSSMYAGEKLGTKNPDFGDVKGTDIFTNGVSAANHFKANALAVYGIEVRPDMPDNELAFAFLAYNRGSMYKNAAAYIGREMSPDESPYVMNGIDSPRVDMHWPDVGHYGRGTDWGEPNSVQGKLNKPLGALTIVHGIREREQGVEAPNKSKVVIIGDSLSVGDDQFAKIQEADAFFNEEIIHYDAKGSRSLGGGINGMDAITAAVPQIAKADSVVIALGTNMPEAATGGEAAYEALLRQAVSVAKGANENVRVFVPEIVSFKDGTAMANRRNARNEVIKKLAGEGLVTFISLDIKRGEFAGDDVHLTQKGYQERTVQILEAVKI